MSFFKTFFASFLAVITAFLVGVPILLILFAGILASVGSSQEKVVIPAQSILHLKLDQNIIENSDGSPFDFSFTGLGSPGSQTGLYQLIEAIDHARQDDQIKGIYLNLQGDVATGWANLSSIRSALINFRNSGKFVYAYSEIFTERSYYLASAADSVFLPPTGLMEFNGLSSNPFFVTGLFEKLEVKPKIFKVGTFKSAVEPFFLKEMSEASRLQTSKYLGDFWSIFAEEVAASRSISREQVDQLATTLILAEGKAAVSAHLADKVAYEDEVLDRLRARTGKDAGEKPSLITLKKYLKAPAETPKMSKNKIGVLFAEGDIVSGKGTGENIGSESLIEELRKLREDKNVKAIVLRINSPGGSALASDMMAREIELTSAVKPIVASMGNVAASGGYYIAAPCDRIFAQKNTITGSIGIFGILFETQALFNDKLGVTFDQVETHPSANIGNPAYPMNPAEEALFQRNVARGYGTFVEVVRKGRNFPDSLSVDKIAQGRVWSGLEAQKINLVDEIGDLDRAIQYAAAQAGVSEDYRVERKPRSKSPFQSLIEDMQEASARQAAGPLADDLKALEQVRKRVPQSGTYALMPWSDDIR